MSANKLPNTIFLANIGFLVANLIWGATSPIIKFTLEYIPPFTLLFLRFMIVCLILLPYVIIKLIEIKVSKKDYLNLLLLGLLSQGSLALIFVALRYTSSLDASIISVITGTLIVYAGHYFYKENVTKTATIGLLITILGTIVVILEPFLSGNAATNSIPIGERFLGNILALVYNLMWVFYVMWSKMVLSDDKPGKLKKTLKAINIRPMTKNYPSALVNSISMYVGLAALAPLAVLENFGTFGNASFNINTIPPEGVAGVFFLAIAASLVAFFLHQWALRNGKVSDSAIIGYLGPVFSFPVALVLLGEYPSKVLVFGAIIVAVGVIIAEIGSTVKNGKS